jgi:hypothetical protein
MSDGIACRLCGGQTRIHFEDLILCKCSCRYMLCHVCGSPQTERPYWLEEAYRFGTIIADFDADVFLRGMNDLCVLSLSARLLRMLRRARIRASEWRRYLGARQWPRGRH